MKYFLKIQCPTCSGQNQNEEARVDLQLEGGVVEVVKEFCYFGVLLDSKGGVRVSVTLQMWRFFFSLLINKELALKTET